MRRIETSLLVLVGLFLLALSVRLAYNHQLAQHPLAETLIIDARDEDEWGREIAGGDWLGATRGLFYRDPLYAYLLGMLYGLFGRDLALVRTLQAVLDALAVVLIALVARGVFSEKAAFLSGLLAALYGPFVFSQGQVMKTSLTLALLALFLWCAMLAAQRGSGALWLVAGLVFGLGLLTRGNFLLLTPVVALVPALWGGPGPAMRRRVQMAFFVTGVAVSLLPVAARNLAYGGSFTFMVPSAGLNFYHGNNASAAGVHSRISQVRTVPEHEEQDARRAAEEAVGRQLSPPEVSAFWMRKGLDFAVHEPLRFLKLLGRKVLLFWNACEVPDVYNYAYFSGASSLLGSLLTFGVIGPLGLVGVFFATSGNKRSWVLVAFGCVFMASVVAFYVTDRYRLPVVVLLIPFAAQAILELVGAAQGRAWRRLALLIGCLAAAGALVNVKLLDTGHFLAQSHVLLGNVLHEQRELDAAEREYRTALRLDPRESIAANNLAYVLAEKGDRLDEALTHALEATRLHPDAAENFDTLATVYSAMGRLPEAEAAIQRAIALAPGDASLRETQRAIRQRLGTAP